MQNLVPNSKMKSNRVYIKANHIKKTKDTWVYCFADLVRNDDLSMLRLISINANSSPDSRRESIDRMSVSTDLSTHTTIPQPQNLPNINLKCLLNLAQYKTAVLKPINFKNTEKFSVKLTLGGMFHKKKLYLIPECDDDLTKWCSILSEHINKSSLETSNKKSQKMDLNDSVFSNKSESSLKRKQETNTDETPEKLYKSTLDNSYTINDKYKDEELYFALDENDVYDGNSLESFYTVQIEDSTDARRLGLRGCFLLRLKKESLELSHVKNGETLHEFPYVYIRRFGSKSNVLRIEAGRRCTTGEGYFMFRLKDASKVAETIKELTKDLKKSLDNQSINSSLTINNAVNGNSVNGKTKSNINGDILNTVIQEDVEAEEDEANYFYKPPKRKTSIASIKIMTSPSHTNTTQYFSVPDINHTTEQSPLINNNSMNAETSSLTSTVIPNNPSRPPIHNNSSLYRSSINGSRTLLSPVSPLVKPVITNVTTQPMRSTTINQPTLVNTAFNRNHFTAASFSYRRPNTNTAVSVPVIRDDSFNGNVKKQSADGLYDNLQSQNRNSFHGNNSSLYKSSYTMPSNNAYNTSSNYDNVTLNSTDRNTHHQRSMKELETMLSNLGIPSNH